MSEQHTIDDIQAKHDAVAEAEREVARRVAARAETVGKALADGVSATAIAKALGVHRTRVYSMARKNVPYGSKG